MKKLFALFLALVLSLSVSALAADSPIADDVHKVHFINGNGTKVETDTVKDGESVTYEADSNKGDFDNFKVYLSDGKTTATAGEHYTLDAGQSLNDTKITLYPKTDLIVTGNYDGKETVIKFQNNEPFSPVTGDSLPVYLVAFVLLGVAGMAISVKKLAVK